MGRFIAVLLDVGFDVWGIIATVLWIQGRNRQKGIEHPEFWLPRRERRARARQLLRREDDAYTQRMVEQAMRNLREGNQL